MKVLLLTNILTPYRKNFYDALFKEFNSCNIQFQVLLMAETEPERNWNYDDFKTSYTTLLPHSTIKLKKQFIHVNKGYGRLLEDINPDIVIASGSYTYPAVWTTIKKKEKLGYELYFWSESHLNELRNYSSVLMSFRELLRKNIYRKFDGYWYAGDLSKRFIEKYAKADSKYVFVPNLINEKKFYFANSLRKKKEILKEKWGVSQDKFIFIFPARLTSVKGIIPFLEILNMSNYKNDIEVLIPGDGEMKEKILQFIENNKLNVKLMGYKNEIEIVELYALADSFLMPSLSDPNPLSCIEAIWAGLPLLVSDHVGNHPEIVKQNKNGYVFSYKDTEESLQFIKKIVNSSDTWRKEASEVSLRIAHEKYETNSSVSRLVNMMKTSRV